MIAGCPIGRCCRKPKNPAMNLSDVVAKLVAGDAANVKKPILHALDCATVEGTAINKLKVKLVKNKNIVDVSFALVYTRIE